MPGDVTITRGVTERDDALSVSGYSGTGSTAAGTNQIVTDGDIATHAVGFVTSSVGQFHWMLKTLGTNPATNTYPKIIIRHRKTVGTTDAKPQLVVEYTDATRSIFDLTVSTTLFAEPFTLTAGKNIAKYGTRWEVVSGAPLTQNFELEWDFIFPFKETLTLPAVSEPLQLSLPRTVVELPIPTREGGVLQDIGSDSARLEIAGALLATTTPNNYTANQWWDVLVGVWLEGNWQWLTSDRVSYKFQMVEEPSFRQDPGKVNYYEFKIRLKKVDILSATAQTFGAIQ